MSEAERAPVDPNQTVQQAIALSQQLEEFLAQNEAEYEKLPVFIKPMARGFFQSRAGQSIGDWRGTAANLTQRLRQMQSDGEATKESFRRDLPELKTRLNMLIAYCQEVPDQTARFSSDAHTLNSLTRYMMEQQQRLRSLITLLDEIERGL